MDARLAELCRRWRAGEMVEKLAGGDPRRATRRARARSAPERMLFHQRMLMLQIVDTQWKDHLYSLDHLKEGIGLRGYGQRDPLVEYKKESFQMFQALMDRIDEEILRWIFLYQPVRGRRSLPPARRPTGPLVRRPRAPAAGAPGGGRRARARAGRRGRQDRAAQPDLQRPERGASRPSPTRPQPREAAGGTDEVQTVKREGPEGRPQRPLPLRQRQEVQEVPRELDA